MSRFDAEPGDDADNCLLTPDEQRAEDDGDGYDDARCPDCGAAADEPCTDDCCCEDCIEDEDDEEDPVERANFAVTVALADLATALRARSQGEG